MYRRKQSGIGNIMLAACFFTIANFLFWNLTHGVDGPPVEAEYSISANDASGLLSSLLNSEVTVKIEHKGHLNFLETATE
jgi:hypothetical protein